MTATPKTRIAMICPICGGEVTHRRYSFDVVVGSPMRWTKWYVCDDCETALSGNDPAARREAENAFIKYLEGTNDAPAP